MKMTSKLSSMMVAAAAFLFTQVAAAAPKTLIEMSGTTPSAGLAKAWKKVKDGEYTFDLDTTQELKPGTPVSPDVVKSSLESKMGTTYGVKVTAKGADKVSVTYSGDEQKFLNEVSKTKIRPGAGTEIALESHTSDGGIRAQAPDREPTAGEVKAIFQKADKGGVSVVVNVSKSEKIKGGSKIKVKMDAGKHKKGDFIYFVPEREDKGVWTPKAGTLIQ